MEENSVSVSSSMEKLKFETTNSNHDSINNNSYSPENDVQYPDSSSEEYLSEPLRYLRMDESFKSTNNYLMNSTESNETIVPTLNTTNNSFYSCTNEFIDLKNIQIPIVGYEIMEERARFTVFKLRIEHKLTGECYYVFRRYTDFVRLCNRLKVLHPGIVRFLPKKRWLGNNFDPEFLEKRIIGLQCLVNEILNDKDLLLSPEIQDFFCLNEPPAYSEGNEESKAILGALEETISDLKQQLREKDRMIESLKTSLHSAIEENNNLKKSMFSSSPNNNEL